MQGVVFTIDWFPDITRAPPMSHTHNSSLPGEGGKASRCTQNQHIVLGKDSDREETREGIKSETCGKSGPQVNNMAMCHCAWHHETMFPCNTVFTSSESRMHSASE